MNSTHEQQEAANVASARKNFPKLKWRGTWSRREKRLRLFIFSWLRGLGPGWGTPNNYNAALSVGVEWKVEDLWLGVFWKGTRDERWIWLCVIPCVPIRFHYRRAYGGWIMSPSHDPEVPRKHRRRWWQVIKIV